MDFSHHKALDHFLSMMLEGTVTSRRPARTSRYTPPCSVPRVAEYSCWNAASTSDPLTCTRVTLRHVSHWDT